MSDAEAPLAVADLEPPRVVVEKRADGSLVLTLVEEPVVRDFDFNEDD